METKQQLVHIVGGGIAGLNCAVNLQKQSLRFQLHEASDQLGGRMRTDEVEGFRLDRGFQVLQTAYPEAKVALDYSALDLVPLVAGALVRRHGRWISMVDPLRHPSYALKTVFNSIGNLADRLRLAKLIWNVRRSTMESLLAAGPDKSTAQLLADDYGFTNDFIQSFFKPWLAGIFLESELATSGRFFQFVFKMLSSGEVSYPRTGIQAIPNQLANQLSTDSIQLNHRVTSIRDRSIDFESGPQSADQIVVALPMQQASRVLSSATIDRGVTSTTCVYFAADRAPIEQPILMLNGDGDGPINHAFVLTNASKAIAPPGKSLISVTLWSKSAYDSGAVLSQLRNWYGELAAKWTELAVYRIADALPLQPPEFQNDRPSISQDVVLCGDYCETASLQGALLSGRIAAQQISNRLAGVQE